MQQVERAGIAGATTTLLLSLLLATAGWGGTASASDWASGSEFDKALRQRISIFRERADLSELVDRLAELNRTAVLIDRRIDPSAQVRLEVNQVLLQSAYAELARQVGADLGQIGSTLMIGRRDELDRLLTLAEWHRDRLREMTVVPSARRVQLLRKRPIQWDDLAEPRQLLPKIAAAWQVTVTNPDLVPHDLWRGGSAIDVDVIEAVSLILGQFDLTFEWVQPGDSIRLVPAPSTVQITRPHRPQGITRREALDRIASDVPAAVVSTGRSELLIRATVLEHRDIERLIGEAPPADMNPEPVPLARRRFPVRVIRKPVGAILYTLKTQGIDLQYDPRTIEMAGIDLGTLISLELDNATAQELFEAICEPVGLTFEINENTVIISVPKER